MQVNVSQLVNMRKKTCLLIVLVFILSFILSGCSIEVREKQDVPEAKYEKIGIAIKAGVSQDGTINITYGMIGVKDNKICGVYLDQIEQNIQKKCHSLSNKELKNSYGLSYKSDRGEWYQQVEALENYIAGKHMTIDEINNLDVSSSKKGGIVPKKKSELGSACELDIAPFLEIINEAYNNLEDTNAEKMDVGETIGIRKNSGQLTFDVVFLALDYKEEICYDKVKSFSIQNSPRESSFIQNESQNNELIGFENYIKGMKLSEVYNIETYDTGNGTDVAVPNKNTDLAEICSIDLSRILRALKECKFDS